MPIIYIIAGPPGAGKSTYGEDYLPKNIDTLNHDKLNAEYKYRQVVDYEERANLKANAFIKEKLLLNSDFGVELNLGFEGHYDFINWVRKFYPNYKIQVILFFTDDIQLCLDRAYLRQLAGGHTVEPDIVERMYKNTISLLRANIYKISYLQFIHTNYNSNELVYSGYYPTRKVDFVHESLPDWVKNSFPEIG